ncbi:hypothetical protein [Confluentibacter flavum]|uniref:Lipoprotein n=1 Tax=Confluentibacter flavum TaxID=1909700 RepID=A0A2N3HM96_9FLAO|nr:hypothetical protein [Confluentibacter flavum]PKQ46100.1 hypothetical protein CSW08_04985 [Confluentibacter flavum]
MKFRNMVKLILMSVFATLTLISCNYILENDKDENDIVSDIQTRINIYKKEAELLLSVSKNNLDILELCEAIEYVDTLDNVAHLTERLEQTHIEISNNYKKLAEDKLISIPNYINISNEFELKNVDDNEFIEKKLKIILNKIKTQIRLLETLGKTTNNVEFKVLAVRDTHELISNTNKIESALNKLNQEAQDI